VPGVPPGTSIAGVPKPQFLSVDGRHILSSERIADDPEWDKYQWTLVTSSEKKLILVALPKYLLVALALLYWRRAISRRLFPGRRPN
jgi:hypothetical protein